MNPLKKVMSWFRAPDADPEREAETHRLRDEQQTIRGSQDLVGFGPGAGNVSPTPDVLHPDEKR